MNIFLNVVSPQGCIIAFDNEKNILFQDSICVLGNESSKLIDIFDFFLRKNHIAYTDINNIVTVNGPGSFTGIRTTILFVNTLAFVYKNIYLTPVSFFDMFQAYPIAKQSSKRDLFVKWKENAIIEIMQNNDFWDTLEDRNIQQIYGHIDETRDSVQNVSTIEYSRIIKQIPIRKEKTLNPLYIKKPNIT